MTIWNFIDFRRLNRYDLNQKKKRSLLIIICLTLLFIYNVPSIFRWFWHQNVLRDEAINCVEQQLGALTYNKNGEDLYVWKSYEINDEKNKEFLIYTGNGKIGTGFRKMESQPFFIKGKRSLDIPLPFYPIIEVDPLSDKSQYATLMHLNEGIAYRITCYKQTFKYAAVIETFYMHRLIPSLFVQEFQILNANDNPLKINFRRFEPNDDLKKQTLILSSSSSSTKYEYFQMHGRITTKHDKRKEIEFIVIAPEMNSLTVEGNSQKNVLYRTFVNYTKPTLPNQLSPLLPSLRSSLKEIANKYVELSGLALKNRHIEAWQQIWRSGFAISHSKAEGSLNSDIINATIYYILSHKSAFNNEENDSNDDTITSSLSTASKSFELLNKAESCYNGHSTLKAPALWLDRLDSLYSINKLVSLWYLTLEKQGCHSLIEAGVQGTMKAIILSLVPLQFTKFHLKLNAQPMDLHRDYFIRGLHYFKNTYLNLTILLGEDNKASIYVAIDNRHESSHEDTLYACDAGCIDEPVKLTKNWQQFPVKQTEPSTALLYITNDKYHLEEFKHTIHVKEVAIAPAHEHHVIALHRHGHQLGGLPALFWVSIVFLIVIFHLFLAKLIYQEYCGSSSSYTSGPAYDRVRYAV